MLQNFTGNRFFGVELIVLLTVGGAPLSALRQYIENQEEIE